MTSIAFDKIQINTLNFSDFSKRFSLLIDQPPWQHSADNSWFDLGNCIISAQADNAATRNHVHALTLATQTGFKHDQAFSNPLNLALYICNGDQTKQLRKNESLKSKDIAVDHAVIKTPNADLCKTVFQTHLGIRLALDQNKPEWGGRMLFFRAGKMTLEIIEHTDFARHEFWGLALSCNNLESHIERIQRAGIDTSEIRDGRKPGTVVATIKDRVLGIPILLIEHL